MKKVYSEQNNNLLKDKSVTLKTDDDFLSELKRRSKSFKNGKAKTYTWEETKAAARKNVINQKI